MFQLFQALSRQELALRQLPVFCVSFLMAATLYKFGSFAWECAAFMATWFVLDLGAQGIVLLSGRVGHQPEETQEALGVNVIGDVKGPSQT